MEKEVAEYLPSGLITCVLNGREVKIIKISPWKMVLRLSEKVDRLSELKAAFCNFNDFSYNEINIKNCSIEESVEKEFYEECTINIDDEEFVKEVRQSVKKYWNYVMAKNYGEESQFSGEMANYPWKEDQYFSTSFEEEKKSWIESSLNKEWHQEEEFIPELAVALDNRMLCQEFLRNDIDIFQRNYLKKNYLSDHMLVNRKISRIYIGNQFCHNLFPDINSFLDILNKAKNEQLEITVVFTYIAEKCLDKITNIINSLYSWCSENDYPVEAVINDWGMLRLVEDKKDYLKCCLGILLNKHRKDPRYKYKKRLTTGESIFENNTNDPLFFKFLSDYGIHRFEYECCGYYSSIPKGHHSLHFPFYQTNSSQFCPLAALCINGDRGKQVFIDNCKEYCRDYVILYPHHLKMVGRYNSIFGFDGDILENPEVIIKYVSMGIDRIVMNFS